MARKRQKNEAQTKRLGEHTQSLWTLDKDWLTPRHAAAGKGTRWIKARNAPANKEAEASLVSIWMFRFTPKKKYGYAYAYIVVLTIYIVAKYQIPFRAHNIWKWFESANTLLRHYFIIFAIKTGEVLQSSGYGKMKQNSQKCLIFVFIT